MGEILGRYCVRRGARRIIIIIIIIIIINIIIIHTSSKVLNSKTSSVIQHPGGKHRLQHTVICHNEQGATQARIAACHHQARYNTSHPALEQGFVLMVLILGQGFVYTRQGAT
jgi:hypothetical protein